MSDITPVGPPEIDCREELWKGFIPIRFICASSDIASSKLPNDVYVLASRYSYLSHTAETAIEYFRSFVIDIKLSIWFESNHIPLKRCEAYLIKICFQNYIALFKKENFYIFLFT